MTTDVTKDLENRFSSTQKDNKVVATDLAMLPSKGKVYPSNSPLHMKEKVEVKLLTAKEENILNNRAYLKSGTAIDKLLRACVVDKNINLDELIIGDKNTILLVIRIQGYGTDYEVTNMRCESCGKEFKKTIDLGKIKIRELDTEPVEPGKNQFTFTLPKLKRQVKFHLLTTKDDSEIDKSEENRKKQNLQPTPITTRLFYQIDEIEGVDPKEKMILIESMPAMDSKDLRNYIDSISPEPIMKQDLQCPFCEETSEYIVPIGIGFFWPRAT